MADWLLSLPPDLRQKFSSLKPRLCGFFSMGSTEVQSQIMTYLHSEPISRPVFVHWGGPLQERLASQVPAVQAVFLSVGLLSLGFLTPNKSPFQLTHQLN